MLYIVNAYSCMTLVEGKVGALTHPFISYFNNFQEPPHPQISNFVYMVLQQTTKN